MRLRTRDEAHEIRVDDAVLRVRPMTASGLDAVRRKCTTHTNGRGGRVEEIDVPRFNREVFAATVEAFVSGVEDEDGRPLEATAEVKATLCELNPAWVQRVLAEADRAGREAEEAARGN